MPVQTGIAAGHWDLLEKIRAFVTSEAQMGSGQAWEELHYVAGDDRELILKGPGLNGNQEIFFGLQTYQSEPADYYNFRLDPLTGFNPAVDYESQPGAGTHKRGVPLFSDDMPYWLVANGQRIWCLVNVEGNYMLFGAGFFFPYGSPGEYPYPYFIAAPLSSDSATRYSDSNITNPLFGGSLTIRDPAGAIKSPAVHPYSNPWWNGEYSAVRDTEGTYPLTKINLYDLGPNRYGLLDGIQAITGFAITVEDTSTVDGEPWVVGRNVYRTGFADYCALRLV